MNAPRFLRPFWIAILLPAVAFAQELTRLGEFKVNSQAQGTQNSPSAIVASNPAGDFVLAWQGLDGTGQNAIYCQRYNSAASPVGSAQQVSATTGNEQVQPAAAMNNDGSFVVIWQDNIAIGTSKVRGQRFDSQARKIGGILDLFSGTSGEAIPAVAANNGRFLAVRRAIGQPHDPSEGGIIAQFYSFANGTPDGPLIPVNVNGTDFDQTLPSVAINQAGTYVIAWRGFDSSSTGVFARQFRSDGTSTGTLSVSPAHQQNEQGYPSVAIAEDGSFIIAFHSGVEGSYDVRATRFNSQGVLTGSDFSVSPLTLGNRFYASVVLDATGAFTIAYRSQGVDNSGFDMGVQRFLPNGDFDGPEFLANTFSTGDQLTTYSGRSLAIDSKGNLVAVWTSNGQDGSGSSTYADKFFLPNQGPPLSEFRVNTTTANAQNSSTVAMKGSGDFVVAWRGSDQNGTGDIFAQRFHPNGTRMGAEMRVNETQTSGEQSSPAAAISNSSGRVALVWTSDDGTTGNNVRGRLYAADGVTVIKDFRANSGNDAIGNQKDPSVAMRDDGQFVVVWASEGQDGSGYGVYGQRFGPDGLPLGFEFPVNITTINSQDFPRVTMNSSGAFVVVWRSRTDAGYNVMFRRFDANGNGEQFDSAANSSSTGEYNLASVGIDSDAKMVIAWSGVSDTSGVGVFARRYAQDGAPLSGEDAGGGLLNQEFRINSTFINDQGAPQVAVAADGSFIISWQSRDQDGDGLGIFAQRYSPGGTRIDSEFQINQTFYGNQSFELGSGAQRIAMDTLGNYVITWDSENQDGNGFGVYATKVFATEVPSITTLSATNITSSGATLNGSVDPNGQMVAVAFEYDDEPLFENPNIVQVVGTFEGINPQNASVVITGLTTGQKVFVRAKATVGAQIYPSGNTITFTPENAAPVANDDQLFIAGADQGQSTLR